MSNSWRNAQVMSLADLVDLVRDRVKRREGSNEPAYYTLHDAEVDKAMLNEIGLLRLRSFESSGRTLADATNNPPSDPGTEQREAGNLLRTIETLPDDFTDDGNCCAGKLKDHTS